MAKRANTIKLEDTACYPIVGLQINHLVQHNWFLLLLIFFEIYWFPGLVLNRGHSGPYFLVGNEESSSSENPADVWQMLEKAAPYILQPVIKIDHHVCSWLCLAGALDTSEIAFFLLGGGCYLVVDFDITIREKITNINYTILV